MSALRAAQVTAGGMLLLVLTACGSGEPAVMPDVVGSQLDVAKSDIERAGFSEDVEVVGGGLFGVLDDTNWVVCEQQPAVGRAVSKPRLVVDRECGTVESTKPSSAPADPSPAPADPSDAPPLSATVVDTTIDELLDRLNSADMGGIQPGEQFRFTGDLFESDAWSTGATGDYYVMFMAKGGADDLMVLLDEADTVGWTDGTQVEMVVENVEITLQGDTSYGWLKMVSATTIQ
jgi:hypothetical protein